MTAGVLARRAFALGLAACAAWHVPVRAEPLPRRPPAAQARPAAADPQVDPDQPVGQAAGDGPAAEHGQGEPAPPQFDDEVVVVGSRARPRSVTESTVPIDAIPAEEIVSQGNTDVGDRLRTIVPSYNVSPQPVGDAARLIRPANLRGLAPDHTLVLVNGRRRHRGAVITWIGNGVADGAQGPDISTIPAIALRRIEVLRDGAAAQYGSDAIAGVLNFLLKPTQISVSYTNKRLMGLHLSPIPSPFPPFSARISGTIEGIRGRHRTKLAHRPPPFSTSSSPAANVTR